jgi:hypothetical protein
MTVPEKETAAVSSPSTPSAFFPADNPAAIAHLNHVQAIIARLAGNSLQCKTWCLAIVGALFGLAGSLEKSRRRADSHRTRFGSSGDLSVPSCCLPGAWTVQAHQMTEALNDTALQMNFDFDDFDLSSLTPVD